MLPKTHPRAADDRLCWLQNVLLHLMMAHPEDDPLRPATGVDHKAGAEGRAREAGQEEGEGAMLADRGAVFNQRSTAAVKQVWC